MAYSPALLPSEFSWALEDGAFWCRFSLSTSLVAGFGTGRSSKDGSDTGVSVSVARLAAGCFVAPGFYNQHCVICSFT